MKTKYLILGLSIVGGLLAVVRLLSAKNPSKAADITKSSQGAMDTYIEDQMRRLSIPGAVLAVIEGDRIVHMQGFSRKVGIPCGQDYPGGKAPLPNTPFFIGSLTKSFTAVAVMQLVEAGKIELDAPIRRYLPWFLLAPRVAC